MPVHAMSTLIKIKDHHLINPDHIICIDLKGKAIFLSGSRYTEVSDEDLQMVLEHCTIIDKDTKEIPILPVF